MTKEITTAGPAAFFASMPVSVKMPVPITTPMPNATRCRALRWRRRWPTSLAASSPAASEPIFSTDFVRNRSTAGRLGAAGVRRAPDRFISAGAGRGPSSQEHRREREITMAIATINPATGETLKTYEPLSEEALEEKIARAAAAWAGYRLTTPEQRVGWLEAGAPGLHQDNDRVAELMTTEMGKTLASAKAEVAKCAKALRWYAEHGPSLLERRAYDADAVGAQEAFVEYQPLGVVLAIMPWNFPLWQAMRFAAPALMAGNVGLLKHASNVPQTALYLEELFRKAGFPSDVFQTLLIGSGAVERVLRDDRVVAATLTGSNAAGEAVARVAGDVIKKTVLELGGSDPYIVMPSADLERAAEVAVTARCQNNGQSCIAAKRFFVHADVAEEFTRLFAEKIAALRVGDPMGPDTRGGRLAPARGGG